MTPRGPRVVFALARLPRSLAINDDRLPHVVLDDRPLRLNSAPIAERYLRPRMDHEAMQAATVCWLKAQCGDYRPALLAFIDAYLAFAAAEIERHREETEALLAPYDGLFAARSWLWSALRPLPLAWVADAAGALRRVDFAFWDGRGLATVTIDGGMALPAEAIAPPSARAFSLSTESLRRDGPAAIRTGLPFCGLFWREAGLPASPFRRPWAVEA